MGVFQENLIVIIRRKYRGLAIHGKSFKTK